MAEHNAVIAGAGMAGLVAAAHLVRSDHNVVVLEKSAEPGGSLAISNGIIWTYLPYEALRNRAPKGDPALHRVLADRFEDDLEWLGDIGVDLQPPTFDVPAAGKEIDPPKFVDHMVELIETGGGEIRTEAPLDELLVDDGAVSGVRVAGPDGETTAIDAKAVIIATGGYQGNERLLERYITDDAANLYLRSVPECTGDGYLAAEEAGAKSTGGHGGFYGHTLAAPPAEFTTDEFAEATQYYGYAAVALDRHGERFTDESESEIEETLAQDVAAHTDGRAYYVFDSAIADETFGYYSAAQIAETASDLGGRATAVQTMHELEATLESWGVNGQRAGETIRAYNRALRAGRQPDPPREGERHSIDDPPYHVVEVKPAITFSMGGLAVTPSMAVKRRSASSSDLAMADTATHHGVVPNLFAAGNDVGNVHRRTYVGGLAHALVSGRVAAESVAADDD
ncbi:MAG: FAD-dependent oxidoreductase [Salinirussus sp.]